LGWTFCGSSYYQLIREANKQKRLEWAREYLGEASTGFEDVIWTDETTVQLESYRRFCCRKRGGRPKNKPRAKHPVKVHVWAGISLKGRTGICIFDGTMDEALLPFVQETFPSGYCRFMQDNDPKHTSRYSQEFFMSQGIYWSSIWWSLLEILGDT
jgi:hypothetical protein